MMVPTTCSIWCTRLRRLLKKKNMISAFDRTFKQGLLLSVLDWLTFNVVFVLIHYLRFAPYFSLGENFITHFLVANISYVIALQFVTISLHHRQSQPAKVLNNTSRTSAMFIVLYTSFLGIFTDVEIPNFVSSIILIFRNIHCNKY